MDRGWKNIALLAGMLLTAACVQETLRSDESEREAICFATLANKATRGDSPALFNTQLAYYHKTMVVYGVKIDKDNMVQNVFDSTAVSYSEGWTYSPLRYWDKQADYQFIAYSPASAPIRYRMAADSRISAAGNVFETSAPFTLTGQNLQQGGPQTGEILTGFTGESGLDADIMLADSVKHAGQTRGTVMFSFSHILAKLNVCVAGKLPAKAMIRLQSMEISGLKDQGTYSDGTWTAAVNDSVYALEYATGVTGGDTISDVPRFFIESLVIPQTAAQASDRNLGKLKIVYTITSSGDGVDDVTETFICEKNINDLFPTTVMGYENGKNYTIKLTVDPTGDAMSFDASVSVWADRQTQQVTL